MLKKVTQLRESVLLLSGTVRQRETVNIFYCWCKSPTGESFRQESVIVWLSLAPCGVSLDETPCGHPASVSPIFLDVWENIAQTFLALLYTYLKNRFCIVLCIPRLRNGRVSHCSLIGIPMPQYACGIRLTVCMSECANLQVRVCM